MGGDPQDVHPASAYLDYEQDIQSAQENRVEMEETAG
jgi:hypothetical protein